MTDLARGASAFIAGFALMLRPRLRALSFIPMALSALLLGAASWGLYGGWSWLMESLRDLLPSWLDWLEWLLLPIFVAACVALFAFLFGIFAAAVASPFNGPLAEATEKLLTGEPPPSRPLAGVLKKLPQTLGQELKKVVYALWITLLFAIPFLIPVVNVAAPLIWFAANAWLTAFAFVDYPMDNNGYLLHHMRTALRRRKLLAIGFGAVALLAFTIPVLNVLAVPAAVCGATRLWVTTLREDAPVERRHLAGSR